jgi:hypothetical protein
MPDTTVTLALEGEVPLKVFAQAIDGFSSLVTPLSEELGHGARIDWTIESLESGSALATAAGVSDAPGAVERVVHAYLEVGEAEQRHTPVPYSAKVKRAADRIATVLNGKITAVRFETAVGEATIYSHAEAGGEHRLLKGFGAVTGRVQTLSSRGGLRFTLFDLLNDRAVSCYLEPNHEEVMRGVWGKVATVEGWVTRDGRTGRPLSVRRIGRVKPQLEVEPGSYRGAAGAIPSKPGSVTAEAAVRQLRDA